MAVLEVILSSSSGTTTRSISLGIYQPVSYCIHFPIDIRNTNPISYMDKVISLEYPYWLPMKLTSMIYAICFPKGRDRKNHNQHFTLLPGLPDAANVSSSSTLTPRRILLKSYSPVSNYSCHKHGVHDDHGAEATPVHRRQYRNLSSFPPTFSSRIRTSNSPRR